MNIEHARRSVDRWKVAPDYTLVEWPLGDIRALVAEVERLQAELERVALLVIEARNPGIDMDEVRRSRAGRG